MPFQEKYETAIEKDPQHIATQKLLNTFAGGHNPKAVKTILNTEAACNYITKAAENDNTDILTVKQAVIDEIRNRNLINF